MDACARRARALVVGSDVVGTQGSGTLCIACNHARTLAWEYFAFFYLSAWVHFQPLSIRAGYAGEAVSFKYVRVRLYVCD